MHVRKVERSGPVHNRKRRNPYKQHGARIRNPQDRLPVILESTIQTKDREQVKQVETDVIVRLPPIVE